jgi:hypothetical protein
MSANGKTPALKLPAAEIEAARRLSWELRNDSSAEMMRRRWVVGLSLVGVSLAQLMALQQTGILRKLPDFPSRLTDPDAVNKAAWAYRRLATPNALFQVLSFGVTAALAAAGGSDRARRRPFLSLALFAKTGFDGFMAAKQAQEALSRSRRVETWPTLSALGVLGSIGLAAVDAWAAARTLGDQGMRRYPEVRDGARARGRRLLDQGRDFGRDLGRRGSELVDRARSTIGELRPTH